MIGNRFRDTDKFGKDHWSMFAYIESRCVDNKGILDMRNVRLDGEQYPTRLYGWFEDKNNPSLEISGHNDLDCADDLEDVGLIENIGTGYNRVYKMTAVGSAVSGELRKHKANGGSYATFSRGHYND